MNEAATEPKSKRRWFQYSLQSLLIVITALGIWLGYISNEARKQKAVVEWVLDSEKRVGTVVYDFAHDSNGKYIPNPKPPGPDWLREWIGIDYFCDVTKVAIISGDAKNLTPLEDLVALESLILTTTSDTDISPLESMTHLKEVRLIFSSVTRRDVQKLQKALPNCKIEWVSNTLSESYP